MSVKGFSWVTVFDLVFLASLQSRGYKGVERIRTVKVN